MQKSCRISMMEFFYENSYQFLAVIFIKTCQRYLTCRSSHRRCSVRKVVLRNFSEFTRKHLCQSLFFLIKLQAGLQTRLWHRCFPVNFANFLRISFLQNSSERLLLDLALSSAKWRKIVDLLIK